jgi:hypothetical protein
VSNGRGRAEPSSHGTGDAARQLTRGIVRDHPPNGFRASPSVLATGVPSAIAGVDARLPVGLAFRRDVSILRFLRVDRFVHAVILPRADAAIADHGK